MIVNLILGTESVAVLRQWLLILKDTISAAS